MKNRVGIDSASYAALGLLLFLAFGDASAQSTQPLQVTQLAKLTPSDARPYDMFGRAVSISQTTLVVGTGIYTLGTGEDAQRKIYAYLFEHQDDPFGEWATEQKKFWVDGANADKQIRYALSLDGDTLAIGSYWDDQPVAWTGATFLFERDVQGIGQWGQALKIQAPSDPRMSYFGLKVAVEADTLVAGAPDWNGTQKLGAAFVYLRNAGGSNSWGLVKKIVASDAQPGFEFGDAVAISGDTLAVSARNAVGDQPDCGAVYLFERNLGGAESWGQRIKIASPNTGPCDIFGLSLSLYQDLLAVGAYGDSGRGPASGATYLFERNQNGQNQWGLVKRFVALDTSAGDNFGFSVSILGDILAVGAIGNDSGGQDSGAVYLFGRNLGGQDQWGQASKIVASDSAGVAKLGFSMSRSDDLILAGAPYDQQNGIEAGAAYVFEATLLEKCDSDGQCPPCQECDNQTQQCAFQASGQDKKNDCPTTGTCFGACDGTGSCQFKPTGTACDDGIFCNGSDGCDSKGVCAVHSGDPCFTPGLGQCQQACSEEERKCVAADGFVCDDGNPCTQIDYCALGVCVSGTQKTCLIADPTNECLVAVCDSSSGECLSQNAPDGTSCFDGDFCSAGQTCEQGVCQGGHQTCAEDSCDCRTQSAQSAMGTALLLALVLRLARKR